VSPAHALAGRDARHLIRVAAEVAPLDVGNDKAEECALCPGRIPVGAGTLALGRRDGSVYLTALHTECAAFVRAARG
jgi:hypothetical protein